MHVFSWSDPHPGLLIACIAAGMVIESLRVKLQVVQPANGLDTSQWLCWQSGVDCLFPAKFQASQWLRSNHVIVSGSFRGLGATQCFSLHCKSFKSRSPLCCIPHGLAFRRGLAEGETFGGGSEWQDGRHLNRGLPFRFVVGIK